LYFNATTNLKEKLVKMKKKNGDAMMQCQVLPNYPVAAWEMTCYLLSWKFIFFFFSVNIFYSVISED